MEKKINSSSIRSKKRIIKALLQLMESNPFPSITVTQVCTEAEIARKTFYRHFKNKESVLNEYINCLSINYLNSLKKSVNYSTYNVTLGYFRFWKKHITFLKLLSKNNLLLLILKTYDILLPHTSSHFPCREDSDETFSTYRESFSSGAYWKLLCKWSERGFLETPEELAAIHRHIIEQLFSAGS